MEGQFLITAFVVTLTILGYGVYIASILNKKTEPHAYTWLTVSVTALTAFFIQTSAGGGLGSTPQLFVSLLSIIVFLLCFRFGTKNITGADFIFLLVSLGALLLWIIADQPLLSIILIVSAEVAGFIPTVRKAYMHPHTENVSFYSITALRHFFSIFALSSINPLTVIYPASFAILNLIKTIYLLIRRRYVKNFNVHPFGAHHFPDKRSFFARIIR